VPLVEAIKEDAELARFSPLFDQGSSLAHRSSPGASGPLAARVQRERLDERLEVLRARLSSEDQEIS